MKRIHSTSIQSRLAALALWLGAASFSTADILVDNLNESSVTLGWNDSSTFFIAGQFYTGSSAYTLNSITLDMYASYNTDGNFFVGIYSSGNADGTFTDGQPVGLLEILSGEDSPSTDGQYTYTSSGLSLDADSNYWVVTGVSSGAGEYIPILTTSSSFTNPSGDANLRHMIYSDNAGSSWDGTYYSAASLKMRVDVAAVPEPATAGLMGISCGVLWLIRRIKKAMNYYLT